MKKKKILFIHQNFPAQFKALAPHLSNDKRYEIHTLANQQSNDSLDSKPYLKEMKNMKHHLYDIKRGTSENIHPLAVEFETKMLRADAVGRKCEDLKKKGFNPDLVINHPGWGETFLIKEIWPKAKTLTYFEFYYNTKGSDIDFDTEEDHNFKPDYELTSRLIARNAPGLMVYLNSDKLISPTKFQKSTAPDHFRNKITVIHDGIDTDVIKPKKNITLNLKGNNNRNIVLSEKDKIITFVNRNLEPYRGYHSFMRSLPKIQNEHPDAYIVFVGGHDVSYGSTPKNGKSHKDNFYNEVKELLTDESKLLYLGVVAYDNLLKLLNIASVHVYLTYPFVLSWSVLEAMALENIIVGSKTEPVEEVIKHNKNGLLVDFFDYDQIAETVNNVLSNPQKYNQIRKNARKTIIDNYDLKKVSIPKQIKIVEEMLK